MKHSDNVITGSFFDVKGLAEILALTRGDSRAAWMAPRGVARVLQCDQISADTF